MPEKGTETRIEMTDKEIFEYLAALSIAPEAKTKAFEQWLEQSKFFDFLAESSDEDVPLYLSLQHVYMYSVFLPLNVLKSNFVDELMNWNFGPDSSWGYGYSFGKHGKPRNAKVFPPLSSSGTSLLAKALPITFLRRFEGRTGYKSYVEINQQLIHLHDLHFDEARQAYCRLNQEGDIEPTAKIHCSPNRILVTLKRDVIDFHMFLTKSVLIRFFDRSVCRDWNKFGSWTNIERVLLQDKRMEIYWRQGQARDASGAPHASFLRGFQLIRNRRLRREMVAIIEGNRRSKKYVSFVAYDWKHRKVREVSCNPNKLGNYFVKSDRPFETSPVFFNPEVLLRYKADPEKYAIEGRHITCRGTWSLETFDVNEAGQVHTYLIYLARLPYSEQLYWKSFNEKPKAGISKRAIQTDFEGKWDLSYDPLLGLKESVEGLQKLWPELWECRDADLGRRLNYPITDSEKEWIDEIHTLDKLVVEGFRHPFLKQASIDSGCFSKELKDIRLLEKILESKNVNESEIESIVAPLAEIHLLRSKFAGHRQGDDVIRLRKDLVRKHGNLKEHFRSLLTRTDGAIKALIGLKFD